LPRTLAVPRTTLPAALQASAARDGDKAAIVYGRTATSYAQLAWRVDALAAWLQQVLGVAAGDRVLVIGQNGPQWVTAAYAVLRAGAVLVPVNAMSKADEIRFQAQDSGARVALLAQDLLLELSLGNAPGQVAAAVVWADVDALPGITGEAVPERMRAPAQPLHDVRLHAFEAAIAQGLAPAALPHDPDALAVLPYTSGTTGRPKGCMHTHSTLLAALVSSAAWKPVHRESVVLTVAPLFHMLGLQNGMNLPLFLGATAVMMQRWHAATAAALIERHRVSVWSAPPAMVIDLFADPATAHRDLSSLVTLTGGGAAMPESVAQMLLQRHGLHYQEAYGLTETASFLHANPPGGGKRQCLGVATPNVDSKIVDIDTLQPLPPGEVGELVTHAPQLMRGYWRNEAADQASFVQLDGRRYFRTGDLARVDDEGYFFLKDRLKRMINVSGYKVWPAEVENTLYAHPAVHEACVIAVPDDRPGKSGGEAVKALVSLKPGSSGEITPEALMAWCREQMAVYKAPRQIEFVAALPKGSTGKILWRELQHAHRERVPDIR
jgi:fatty-acyl-CoA synthase